MAVENGYDISLDQSGAIVRLPKNISSDTQVHVYFVGNIGGVNNEGVGKGATRHYIDTLYARDPNFEDIIIVVNNGADNVGWDENINEQIANVERIVSDIETTNHVSLANKNVYGSSIGARYALKYFAHECMEGDEGASLYITGASTVNGYYNPEGYSGVGPNSAYATDEEYEAMRGHAITLVERGNRSPENYDSAENYEYVKQFNAHGCSPVLVKRVDGSHDGMSTMPLQNGIFNVAAGREDAIDAFYNSGDIKDIIQYDQSTGQWNRVTPEVYKDYLSSGRDFSGVNYNSIDFSEYMSDDDFKITEYDSSLVDKFSPIANMGAAGGISYLTNKSLQSNLHDTKIVNDLEFVKGEMDGIRSCAQNTSFLSSLRGTTFRNSTGIPGCLMTFIEAYFNAVGALLNSLASETNSVMSYAQAFADMDADFANKAGRIAEIDTDGNMSTVNSLSYKRPTYNMVTPEDVRTGFTLPSLTTGAVAATGAAAASGATVASSNQHVSGNTGTSSGGISSSSEDAISVTEPNRGNVNVETTQNEDGTYTTTRTNVNDNTVIETTYDSSGNKINSVTTTANDTGKYGTPAKTGNPNGQPSSIGKASNSNVEETSTVEETTDIDDTGKYGTPVTNGNPNGQPSSIVGNSNSQTVDEEQHDILFTNSDNETDAEKSQTAYIVTSNKNTEKALRDSATYEAQLADNAVKKLAHDLAYKEAQSDTDFKYSEAEIEELAEEKYKWLQSGGWREYETELDAISNGIVAAPSISTSSPVISSQVSSSNASVTDTAVTSSVNGTSSAVETSASTQVASNQVSSSDNSAVEVPSINVKPPVFENVRAHLNSSSIPATNTNINSGVGSGLSVSGGSYYDVGESIPTASTQIPKSEEVIPTKQSEHVVVEETKPIKEIKPAETNTGTPSNTYNYYTNPVPQPVGPKVEEPVIEDIEIPEIEEPIVEEPTEVISEPETKPIQKHNSTAKTLGAIAGVAAAGAGIAGLAYEANKIMKENKEDDEEGNFTFEEEEDDDDKQDRDANGEINLSDEI